MTTIYIAFDGTPFKNENDCKFYEWKQNHSLLDTIEFYDKNGTRSFDYFSEDTYTKVEKIIVKDEPSLAALKDLANYTGFCCYEDITSVGTWNWDGDEFVIE